MNEVRNNKDGEHIKFMEYLVTTQNVKTRELYEEVFREDSQSFVEYYYDCKAKENQIMVQTAKNQIVSMLHRNPYTLYVDGNYETIDYIVAVATKEEYRNQGRMGKLLRTVLRDMYEEGKSFTYLMPAAEKIYTPYQFTFVYDQYQKQITGELFHGEQKDNLVKELGSEQRWLDKVIPDEIYNLSLVEVSNDQQLDELIEYSNAYLKKEYRVYAYRDKRYYCTLIEELKVDQGNIVLLYQKNSIIGYCFVAFGSQWEVKELNCNKGYEEMFLTLLYQKLEFQTMRLSAVRYGDKVPTIMARITNLSSFLRYISAKRSLSIRIKIEDPILEDLNGIFRWDLEKESSRIEKLSILEEMFADNEPELILGIQELTAWLFGYKDILEIIEKKSPRISLETREKLRQVKTLSDLYINDAV